LKSKDQDKWVVLFKITLNMTTIKEVELINEVFEIKKVAEQMKILFNKNKTCEMITNEYNKTNQRVIDEKINELKYNITWLGAIIIGMQRNNMKITEYIKKYCADNEIKLEEKIIKNRNFSMIFTMIF
jgi:hypothetical protein